MSTIKKIKSFVEETKARINGDEAAVISEKNRRKAESAIKSQIAALEAKLVDDETDLENSLEAYENCIYPTTRITDNKAYAANIIKAKADQEKAEKILQLTKDSISFYNNLLRERF